MRWMVRGEVELPEDRSWMSPIEQEQARSLRFTKRRQEYLTRRWCAKNTIAAEVGLGPDELRRIEIRNHPSGAPWVAIDGDPADIEVSLTDRAGWAVCLVGADPSTGRLGVDLELAEPRSAGFVNDYLTPAEQEYVLGHADPDRRHAAANLMWSAKEAALKVLQVGLRADTRTVEVSIAPVERGDGWGVLGVAGRGGDEFHGWWRRDGEFVLTIVTRARIEPPSVVPGSADLTTATPLHSWVDQPLADG